MRAKQPETPTTSRDEISDYLISLPEVIARTGMGRAFIYSSVRQGTFPAPAKNGTASRWSANEVQQWIVGRLVARAAKGTAP